MRRLLSPSCFRCIIFGFRLIIYSGFLFFSRRVYCLEEEKYIHINCISLSVLLVFNRQLFYFGV